MRNMLIIAALIAFALAGCSASQSQIRPASLIEKAKIQETKHQWVNQGGWHWVCKADGRVDDGLVLYDQAGIAGTEGEIGLMHGWFANVRGENYGEFKTELQAKAQVEIVFTAKGFACPD